MLTESSNNQEVRIDYQSRKWQLTINNPVDLGFTHNHIKEQISSIKSILYYCMADEIGTQGTYHTHVFICCKNGIRFRTLQKKFPGVHLEICKGTAQENMEYVSKTGKWEKHKKKETCIEGTFEEYGELPPERPGRNNNMDDLYSLIKEGYTDYQIMEQLPEFLLKLDKIDIARQTIIQERYKETWRELDVSYYYGNTGTGKTRSIMEKYGYSNVFRVTDYQHPFDNYKGQDVVIFEEFRSSIRLADMLNYLDGYPLELPCRYANKYACYTKVYIVSNISLYKQYKDDLYENTSAFYRRIHHVFHYTTSGIHELEMQFLQYHFRLLLNGEVVPFDS